MQLKIRIFSNDNVFFLLLKSQIEAINADFECEKVPNFRTFNHSLNLILVDGKMSDISAIELVYLLRYEHNIRIPIWFFSEVKIQSYLDKALEVGVNRIFYKPFDPIELSHEIIDYVLHSKSYLLDETNMTKFKQF